MISLHGILLAEDVVSFEKTLFFPVNGRTADGYIARKLKNGIRIRFMNEDYVLNSDGVFCLRTKVNGKPWYSYGGKLNARLNATQRAELADAIRAR